MIWQNEVFLYIYMTSNIVQQYEYVYQDVLLNQQNYPRILTCNIDKIFVDDLHQLSSQAYRITTLVTKELLSEFNIYINTIDSDSEEMAIILSKHEYDCICYYAHSDTLCVPISIYNHIMNENPIECVIHVFDCNMSNNNHKIFESVKYMESFNRLLFDLGDKSCGLIGKFEYETYGTINKEDFSVHFSYINMPYQIYSKILMSPDYLYYDCNHDCYMFNEVTSYQSMNLICRQVLKDGIKTPILVKCTDDRKLIAWSDIVLFISALYLPTIPVCLIYDRNLFDSFMFKYKTSEQIESSVINRMFKSDVYFQ